MSAAHCRCSDFACRYVECPKASFQRRSGECPEASLQRRNGVCPKKGSHSEMEGHYPEGKPFKGAESVIVRYVS